MTYLTINEAAKRLNRSANKTNYLVYRGELEHTTMYGKKVIPVDAIKRYKRKQNRLKNHYVTVPVYCKSNNLTRNKFESLKRSGKIESVKIGNHVYVEKECV